MAFYDLRDFLESCRKENDLIEVDRYVDVNLEMGKALKKSYANNGPVIIFRNNGTDYPAVGGVFGNRKKALRALNAQNNTVLPWFAETIDRPIAPVMVKSAPCQEIIIEGEDVDLGKFPIPKFSELDGGPYLTAGISISKDPETGIADLGHYRFQAIGKDYFGFMAQPFHRLGKNCNKAKALGMKKFEMALVVGTDPVLAYTCQVQNVPDTTDDWSLAGALRGQPVELVKCRTIDVEVPATAEFVFELEIDFETEVREGPLGEYTGYMTPASERPIARVKAITHRKDPYFQVLLTGKPVTENHILKNIPLEASFYNAMKKQFPTITDVAVTPSGGVQLYAVIAMKQRYANEARHVILSAMSSNVRPKWIVVVDPDINVHDSAEVEWALSFRVDPGRDVILVNNVPSAPLDPSSHGDSLQEKTNSTIGIDATMPFGKLYATVAEVAGWEDYSFPEISSER